VELPEERNAVMNQRWDAALRRLARRSHGPFRTLAYGVAGSEEDLSAVEAELAPLADEVVAEVADPFAGALQRPFFKSRVLSWIKPSSRRDSAPDEPRRALEALASELSGFLDHLDHEDSGLGRMPVPARIEQRVERSPGAIVRVRRFEDLGGDAEAIAGAVEAVLLRGGHLEILLEGMDTRTREGRALAAITMRLGDIKAARARERSLVELDRRRDALQVYGPVPFGFARQGEGLIPVPDQMQTVSRVRELARRGISPLESAIVLNGELRRWKDGTPWTGKRVGQILRNPIYERHLRGTPA
jgi:hypothetical protein